MGRYRIDMPGPVLFFIVPCQFVFFYRIIIVFSYRDTGDETGEQLAVKGYLIDIERGCIIFNEKSLCLHLGKHFCSPRINTIIMRIDIHEFRVGTNDPKKRTFIFFYFCSSLFSADDIVRD